jgi:arylsulfatase A-like enzyme
MIKLKALLLVLFASTAASVLPATDRPNIVYILADDMGHGDIQQLNPQSRIPTPHLDRLALEGMAFTQGYSGASICTPTRYGILTGRYPWREHIGLAVRYKGRMLLKDQPTVATMLHEQGYKNICIGKWHLGLSWTYKDGSVSEPRQDGDESRIDFSKDCYGSPVDHGFDSFYGISSSLDDPPYVYIKDRRTITIPTEVLPKKNRFGYRPGLADPSLQPDMVLNEITHKAVEVIQQQSADQPFFLYMALTAPHSPVKPSPLFLGKSGMDEHADVRMEVDWSVGQVLKALEQKGLDQNTIVIFTADNGSHGAPTLSLPKFGHDTHDGRRGHKGTLFEGGHRVPFLVRWPQGIKGQLNRRDTRNITLEDFIATCAEILAQDTPQYAVDSVSFLPQLQNKEPHKERQVILSSRAKALIVRQGPWKLILQSEAILSQEKSKEKETKHKITISDTAPLHQRVTLYNIHQDIAETRNLTESYPELVTELIHQAYKAVKLRGRSNRGEPTGTVHTLPQHQESLLKLGKQ